MSQILEGISPNTKVPYDYRGSVCVLDAETFLDYYDLLPALHQQVAYGGAIIVNKVDLVDEEKLSDVLEKLSSINNTSPIHVTTYCKVDFRKLIDELRVPDKPGEESSNTVESRPKTFTLVADEIVPRKSLEKFLHGLQDGAYRIKGFANTEEGTVYISGVKNHMEIVPWNEPVKQTEIVVISAVGIRMMSMITSGLKGSIIIFLTYPCKVIGHFVLVARLHKNGQAEKGLKTNDHSISTYGKDTASDSGRDTVGSCQQGCRYH